MAKISLGMDPEFMLKDAKGNLKSAIGVVFGTKENRLSLKNGHQAYYDNVLSECSVKPGFSKDEIVGNLRDCLQQYAELVSPLKLTIQASAYYPQEELNHEDALAFGCLPEYCAYALDVVNPPLPENASNFRSAGGHVHVGFNGGKSFALDEPGLSDEELDYRSELNAAIEMNRLWVVRMMDLFLGIPSILIDKDPTSLDRKKLYGKAGTHRICKAYGVEYRPLSNFWLLRPSLVELVFDLSKFSAAMVMKEKKHEKIWEELIEPDKIKKTIDTYNTKSARSYLKLIYDFLPTKLKMKIEKEIEREFKPDDFYKNWKIKT